MARLTTSLKRVGLALLLLTLMGIGYQQWGERRDARAFPPPGRLVDVGGHRLHIWCIGQGTPTILMLAGGGTPSVASYNLQVRLATLSRVCSYDRAGLGWSEPPPRPRDLRQAVADLDTLLAQSGEQGPFVLVPESFGGLVALAFASRKPADVAAIVAVDPSEPETWHRVIGSTRDAERVRNALWQVGWRVGVIRLLLNSQAPYWVNDLPPRYGANLMPSGRARYMASRRTGWMFTALQPTRPSPRQRRACSAISRWS